MLWNWFVDMTSLKIEDLKKGSVLQYWLISGFLTMPFKTCKAMICLISSLVTSFQFLALEHLGEWYVFRENEMHINWFVLSSSRKISQKSIISAFLGMLTFNLGWLAKEGISGWWSSCFHFSSKYCSFWDLLSSIFRPNELLPTLARIHLLLLPLVRTPNKKSYY